MNENDHRPPERRIDIQREELADYTRQFLAQGGRIVELPAFVSKPPPAGAPLCTNLRDNIRNEARKREERSQQILGFRRGGMSSGDIARQLGVDRSVVTRLLKARGLI